MAIKKLDLSQIEIAQALQGEWAKAFPPILTKKQVAELFQQSVKTIDDWMAKGRLDGTYRRLGKRCVFWRDRVISKYFNQKEKRNERTRSHSRR